MDYEMTMLALAVALPAAAPITSYIKHSSIRVFAAVFFCGCIMLNSWLLFFTGNIFASVRNLYIFVTVFNFAILGYCTYIAFKRKSFFVFMAAVLEAALMCWFLIHKKYAPGNSTVVIADTLSKLFVFAVSSAGSIFALLWSKYADERSHGHNMKLFRIIFFCIAAVNFAAVSGNLFFFPLAINIIGLAVYCSMAEEKGLEMHEGSVLALKYFLSASLIFFAAVCFLYSYNGGGDGLSIVLLLKMGGLKSAGKISIAVIMLYISAFICAALPPFHRWASPASSAFFQASLVCICSIPLGLFLIFRLAPVFPLLAYSSKASGMIIGYSAALFGSFAFFSCSALSCIKKDIMQACPYFLSGIGGIICACAGTGIPAAVSGGFFLFCFAYAFCCIMLLCQFVPDDPCCSFIRKITAVSLYMPPFGVFFALWMILEAFFNASVIIPGSGLTVFTSSVLPLSAAFFTVVGIALSMISWTAKGASSPSYMPL
ncbi:MAG: hypothetical protein MJ234_01050 [bacterium]|nr:hypothetical protein [bacterium]